MEPRYTAPFTAKVSEGEVVPIPTFLEESTTSPVPPTVRSEEKRLVEEAVVEKKLVVVAEVPVAIPKSRLLAFTREPEKVELVITALVKLPPLVRLDMALERWPESLSD